MALLFGFIIDKSSGMRFLQFHGFAVTKVSQYVVVDIHDDMMSSGQKGQMHTHILGLYKSNSTTKVVETASRVGQSGNKDGETPHAPVSLRSDAWKHFGSVSWCQEMREENL